ncbi:MAG TPA: SigE family RNA polymerase sigma factor [Frankiaceae bacterium]|nr:SigE family RNA polymerase sigma factor [Frankiaceae bacterium]
MTEAIGTGRVRVSDADEALGALYAAHYRSLVRLAALLLDDPQSCEDVVQDAYLRVHRSWRRIGDQNKALAYLRQTVVNLSRSALRRRLVAQRHAPRPDRSAQADAAYATVERDALVRALRTIPRREREAVVLRYYGDLTEAQAADVMGCSVGSVKGYTSRGLARLGTRLQEEDA